MNMKLVGILFIFVSGALFATGLYAESWFSAITEFAFSIINAFAGLLLINNSK